MSTSPISYDSALYGLEISAITLTIFNGIAAGLVIIVLLYDNLQQRKNWLSISWERRTPLYLAISILLSQIVFATREFLEIGSLIPSSSGDTQGAISEQCIAANEATWWGIIHQLETY